jgi:HSP20 family protein
MKLMKSNSNLYPSLFSDFFDVDRFFNDFPRLERESWLPAANIKETDKNYEIDLAVPGMQKNDIKMELDDHILNVSAEKKEEESDQEKNSFVRREYKYTSFNRSFSLPKDINEDNIKCNYQDGVLKITIDKKEPETKQKKTLSID